MEESEMREPEKKRKIRYTPLVSVILLSIGAASLILSILYVSFILAFVGLGLTFWGALLFYIQPEEYTSKAVLDAILLPFTETLNQVLGELDYKGKAVYLPPEYMINPDESKVYIPKYEDGKIPTVQLVQKHGDKLFIENPEGILVTPAGAELTKLFEKRLNTSFAKKDLEYIQEKLPKLLIEELQIVEELQILENSTSELKETELEIDANTIRKADSIPPNRERDRIVHVKIRNSIFRNLYEKIGSPISSAIACTLAKVTGNPIIIERTTSLNDGEMIQTTYLIPQMERSKSLEHVEKTRKSLILRSNRSSKIVGSLITISGIALIFLVGWITWYDMTVWGKDLYTILLSSRTGEIISLGIDMKVIYYLLIGLVLIMSGFILYIRKKETE